MRARTQVENWTHVLVENGNEWPKDPDPTWNVTQCLHGWNYDRWLDIEEKALNLDLKIMIAGLSMPTLWSQSLT